MNNNELITMADASYGYIKQMCSYKSPVKEKVKLKVHWVLRGVRINTVPSLE